MKSALIINTISDAEHCVKHKLCKGTILFSTHSSVDVYLKELHNLQCICLSKFLKINEIIHGRINSYATVDNVLHELDNTISPIINNRFGLKMKYFEPLYSYSGRCQFSIYNHFISALKKALDIHKIRIISIYNHKFDMLLNSSTDINYLIPHFFKNIECSIINSNQEAYADKSDGKTIYYLSKLAKHPIDTSPKVLQRLFTKARINKYRNFSKNKKTILLSEPLCELDFLNKTGLHEKYNVLYYKLQSDCPLGFENTDSDQKINIGFDKFTVENCENNSFVQVFLKDLYEDFSNNIEYYIKTVLNLASTRKQHPISLGIWGLDPVSGVQALRYEYLKSEGIKVLGAQHGGLYAEILSMQYEVAFDRCHYFIGYGYTREDLQRLCPDKSLKTEILPFGKTIFPKSKTIKKEIDILFPITTTPSMLEAGHGIYPPDRLAERQLKLLEYFNALNGVLVYVKPFINSNYSNLALLPVIKRLKNLRVVDHIELNQFLYIYHPRVIIMEYPSQPLYEVIHLDAEIFLMGDPVFPWEDIALKELKRRVHYSEDTDEMISMITAFLAGQLEKKRDDTFYNHYVYKKNAKENILRFIDNLVENPNSTDI